MTTKNIGQQLVDLCKAGKNQEAMKSLYADAIVSVEAFGLPGQSPQTTGLAACLAKAAQWAEMTEVHGRKIEGPFPHGDRFAVFFETDITRRPDNQRLTRKEVAVYTVKDDKIVREEFFYTV